MARAGRYSWRDDHGDPTDADRATGGAELAALLVVAPDLPNGVGGRNNVPLPARTSIAILWGTPESPATVRLELKVKPKLTFIHG
jgi:hypothetical protein